MARQASYHGRTVVVETDEERAARILAQPRRWVVVEGYTDSGSYEDEDGLVNGTSGMVDVPADYDITRLVGDVGAVPLGHPDFDHVADRALDQVMTSWSGERVEPVYGQGRYITSARYATEDEIGIMAAGTRTLLDLYPDTSAADYLTDFASHWNTSAAEYVTEKDYVAYLNRPRRLVRG